LILIFVAAITALVFIDAEHMILPNAITYPGIVFSVSPGSQFHTSRGVHTSTIWKCF
jgi:hypothetical protein